MKNPIRLLKYAIAIMAVAVLAFNLLPVASLFAQDAPPDLLGVAPPAPATLAENNLAIDAGVIIGPLMILGMILKNAFPGFPNRFIPVVTLLLGVPGFMFKSGDMTLNGFVTAFLVAITAVGVHSGIKNTFEAESKKAVKTGGRYGSLVSLIAVAILLGQVMVQAQLTTTAPIPVERTKSASGVSSAKALSFKQSSLLDANEITIAIYPTYAPDLVVDGKKEQWGAGVALLYPVAPDALNNHAYTGFRLDYIAGGFYAPSATIGLKMDIQVFGHNVTPFINGGAVVPLSDRSITPEQDASIGAIVGTGFTANVWSSKNGKASANVFAAVEKWSNFPGTEIYHVGAAFNFKF